MSRFVSFPRIPLFRPTSLISHISESRLIQIQTLKTAIEVLRFTELLCPPSPLLIIRFHLFRPRVSYCVSTTSFRRRGRNASRSRADLRKSPYKIDPSRWVNGVGLPLAMINCNTIFHIFISDASCSITWESSLRV